MGCLLFLINLLILLSCGSREPQNQPPPKNYDSNESDFKPLSQEELKSMTLIPAGTFIFGLPENNSKSFDNTPQRIIFLDDFYVDKFEVSNKDYSVFLEYVLKTNDHSKCHKDEPKEKNHTPDFWQDNNLNKSNLPVVGVDWFDAYSYARWKGKRLLTETEWERIARGTNGRLFPWGNEFIDEIEYANIALYSYSTVIPVDSLERGKSKEGCYNLIGNVAEWCLDFYSDGYYKIMPDKNPKNSTSGQYRVVRGGSFANTEFVNSTRRFYATPFERRIDLGFRCAVSKNENK